MNNAGVIGDNLIHKMDSADWNDVLTVALTGIFHCSRAAQRHIAPARYGRIASLSSRSALSNRGQARPHRIFEGTDEMQRSMISRAPLRGYTCVGLRG